MLLLAPGATPNEAPSEGGIPATSPLDDPRLAALRRIPDGCSGVGTITLQDLVVFNGESTRFDSATRAIALSGGWRIDDHWDNAVIGTETRRNQTAITFANEGLYHGFKISAPSLDGVRRTFILKGMDLYFDSSPSTSATFGMRIIKPGENEGPGDGESRSWFKQDAADGGRDFGADLTTIDGGHCRLLHFYPSQAFLKEGKLANRFIWEMMQNWSASDKLFLYKIVLKDLEWK